jgi:hypothetical protein
MKMHWTGTCSSKGFTLMGVGFTLIFAALGAFLLIALNGNNEVRPVGWLLIGVGIFVGLSGWSLSSLRVDATDTNVSVRFTPLGLPRRNIQFADIASVEAIMVDPMKWGGWGYRWIPWAHASAAVIRKGPGLEFLLKDGRRFAVTVDDAVTGAQTISSLIG